ncbi:hypothetical protein G9A89_017607 [Geosiphon pyriformis]|nr:hypothetical protein G9A89_017607 [Geosiphon pyriformis]
MANSAKRDSIFGLTVDSSQIVLGNDELGMTTPSRRQPKSNQMSPWLDLGVEPMGIFDRESEPEKMEATVDNLGEFGSRKKGVLTVAHSSNESNLSQRNHYIDEMHFTVETRRMIDLKQKKDAMEVDHNEDPVSIIPTGENKSNKNFEYVDYQTDFINRGHNQLEYDPQLNNIIHIPYIELGSKKRNLSPHPFVEIPTRKKTKIGFANPKIKENIMSESVILSKLGKNLPNDLEKKETRQVDMSFSSEEEKSKLNSSSEIDYKEFDLSNFVIYDEFFEYVNISDLQEAHDTKIYYWNGIVSQNNQKIQSLLIEFTEFSIGGFGDKEDDVIIWLRSTVDQDVWYKLGEPHIEYAAIYHGFHWKAMLAKYVIDWVDSCGDIEFDDFRAKFYNWLSGTQTHKRQYQGWISAINGKTDFRSVIITCGRFIWNQAFNLAPRYKNIKLFKDIGYAYEANIPLRKAGSYEKTVVTPIVHRWFQDLFPENLRIVENIDFDVLEATSIEPKIPDTIDVNTIKTIDHINNLPIFQEEISGDKSLFEKVIIDNVTFCIGDVVELDATEEDSWTKGDKRWICMITEIQRDKRFPDRGFFRMVWMYFRSQTLLSNLDHDYHPQADQELFFTKHCECQKRQPLSSIKRKVIVNFGVSSCPKNEHHYFCRYYYRHNDGDFVAFPTIIPPQELKTVCECGIPENSEWLEFLKNYEVGDCVLIEPRSNDVLNYYTVTCIEEILIDQEILKLRRFYRWGEIETKPAVSKNPINELLYSDYIFLYKFCSGMKPCHVEYYKSSIELPVNLQHRGAGNHFFFSKKYYHGTKRIIPLDSENIANLFPNYSYKVSGIVKLRGLDLFCGGGSLGRGFEDAGFVDCRWAVDKYEPALKTYKQNSHNKNVTIIHESVNKILENAILERESDAPTKGEVDIILAGSPCQGFSRINKHKGNDQSRANNSLVTSLASFVDHYRPKYVLLENVASMARTPVFLRLIACLLELGYQIKFGLVSAEHMGCAQSRCRIFLWGASTNEVLPEMPPVTHTPSKFYRSYGRTLQLPSSLSLKGLEEDPLTSFPLVSIEKLIGDLPPLDNGIIWHPEYPDHRTHSINYLTKEILRRVPAEGGADYYLARERHTISELFNHPAYEAKVNHVEQKYKYCQRIDKNGVFPTICTSMRANGYHPQVVHFNEPRLVSIREAARAQGFLESDIICGTIADQYKIIGNSVPRNVAFSLGLQLGKAITKPCQNCFCQFATQIPLPTLPQP